MVNLDLLEKWLALPAESEQLEFKEAKRQFDGKDLLEYCVAIANERGGHLILGVTNRPPRKVVGSQAFLSPNAVKDHVFQKLRLRIEITELAHPDGRVVVIGIPSRPRGQAVDLDGRYLMRVGESVRPMTFHQLNRIASEGQLAFLDQAAGNALSIDEVTASLDIQSYFDLIRLPFPGDRDGVLTRLSAEGFIRPEDGAYSITNLGAVLLAKDLRQFPAIWRKAPRVIVYKGKNKLETLRDQIFSKGYAAGFEGLIGFINSQLPANEVIGQARREELRLYPELAIRELVANALIHQDFEESGATVMIEIYADRLEITNPGVPLIKRERFVDAYKSRNERLADFMRRIGVCEEKGSGIDKVVSATEMYQLPGPDFRIGEQRTSTILFAHKDFGEMDSVERVWACYLHCCLRYVSNEKMTNQSLRDRFRLSQDRAETVSRIITEALDQELIKPDDPESRSKRYARYVPFWG